MFPVLITNRQPSRLPWRHIHDHTINDSAINTHPLAPVTTTSLRLCPSDRPTDQHRAPHICRCLYHCVLLTEHKVHLPVSVPRHNTTAESSSSTSIFMSKTASPYERSHEFLDRVGLLGSSRDQCLHLRCRSVLLSLLKADDNTKLVNNRSLSQYSSSNVAVYVSICSTPVYRSVNYHAHSSNYSVSGSR